MIMNVPDHPDIVSAMRTGYPSWVHPVSYVCENCGDELEFDKCYEDETYEYLCEHCLLKLHRKG